MANSTDDFLTGSDTDLQDWTDDNGNAWNPGANFANNATVLAASDRVEGKSTGFEGSTLNATTPATAEYDVQCDVNLGSAARASGPSGRNVASPTNNQYFVIWHNGVAEWRLIKMVSGAQATLGTYAGDSPSTTRAVKLQIRNAAKKVFIDGVERISSADNAITATGNPGLHLRDDFSGWWIDLWSTTDAGGAAATSLIFMSGINHALMTM